MAEKSNDECRHSLVLQARAEAVIEGVIEVYSFDEEAVVLKTSCGEMTLEGDGLHVGALDIDRGTVRVEGRIQSVSYGDGAPQKRGLAGRLFGR